MKIAVTLEEATELVPVSVSTLRKAIRKDVADGVFPPPLTAKRNGRGALSIKVTELEEWHDSWDDA